MNVTRRGFLKTAGAAAAGAIAGGAGVPVFHYVTRPRPDANVVLIIVDALRPDHLGCYGYPRPTSPNIDALAAESTVYLRNKAQSSYTPSSVASLFTAGPVPMNYLPDRALSLPEILRAAGYRTFAVQTNPWLDDARGYTRGFDVYEHLVPRDSEENLVGWWNKPAGGGNTFYSDAATVTQTTRGVISSIRPGERFFLYLHYMDVHAPYIPKDEFDVFSSSRTSLDDRLALSQAFQNAGLRRKDAEVERLKDAVVALYDGEIREADDSIGAVVGMLKSKGLFDDSVIVLASDHGEAFGEHGQVGHVGSIYEMALRTPLIIKSPRRNTKAETKILSRNMDIAPTVLRECGFNNWNLRSYGLRGRPLQNVSPDDPEFSQAIRIVVIGGATHTDKSVEKDGFKLIVSRVERKNVSRSHLGLFNLWHDPNETVDLCAAQPSKVAELRPHLPGLTKDWGRGVPIGRSVTQAQEKRLRDIGYLN